MQVKQFWPPTKHKLLYTNVIVYGIAIVLLLVFYHELMWAQNSLRIYLFTDGVPNSADRLLINQAMQSAKKGEDVKSTQRLFERAIQIEPYSEAKLMLGYCHFVQGEYDKMLACYEEYRSINPSNINVYKDMIEVLEIKQDHEAIAQLLMEGIKHFRRRVELYKPHYDPNVLKVFNHKAFNTYKDSQEALKFLEKMQEQTKL